MRYMSFQENLRKYRQLAGYKTAKEFANTLSTTTYDAYLSYETKGREPRYKVLEEIAVKLGTTPNNLLGWESVQSDVLQEIQETRTQLEQMDDRLQQLDKRLYQLQRETEKLHEHF